MIYVFKIIAFFVGLVSLSLFYGGYYLPITISIIIISAVSLFLFNAFIKSRLGLLTLFLWMIYIFPFIHIIEYLWFDFGMDAPKYFWGGLHSNPYMFNEEIIKVTAMIGALGGLGFATAVSSKPIIRNTQPNNYYYKTLELPVWSLWVLLGLFLSWFSAPQDTIFTAAYTTSSSLSEAANFSSAWMVSYAILTFTFCDSIYDSNKNRKYLKQRIMFIVIAFILVYFQLLRGDRESLPFIFACLMTYYFWAKPQSSKIKKPFPWKKAILTVLVIQIVSITIGLVRAAAVGINFVDLVGVAQQNSDLLTFRAVTGGTWTAVLLTPLSTAGDYVNGLIDFKYGRTYLDLLLSAPPGFIADAIGYTRPITGLTGPAWEMRYGIGGTHASVVPFLNFGMLGVFFVNIILANAFSNYERVTLASQSVVKISFLGIIAMAAPHWLWYGEKNIMNALVLYLFLAILYRLCLSIKVKKLSKSSKYLSLRS